MRLIVGLGNPGPGHAGNRHNIGFMAVDRIVHRHRFAAPKSRFDGYLQEGEIAGERALALRPLTYMNESGRSVAAAARFYKIPPEDVLVIHDEIDLVPGKLRVKRGGGAGGHNGLRSIDQHLGPDYWRIRLGVGHPGVAELVKAYVLQDFLAEERPGVVRFVEAVAEAFPLLLASLDRNDPTRFISKVHVLVNPPPPKPKREPPSEPPAEGSD
ncbi:MAG: aminoacyl-tRNA hydrolase [Dongiaceae bacterium]